MSKMNSDNVKGYAFLVGASLVCGAAWLLFGFDAFKITAGIIIGVFGFLCILAAYIG